MINMKDFIKTANCSFSLNTGSKEISRISGSFFKEWDIENFYYVRISKKGELVYLTNHVDFCMNYWEAGLPLRTGFNESAKAVQSYALAWGDFIDEGIRSFAETQHCYSGFSFVDRYHDTIQFATFFRSSPLDNPSQFYLKNKEVLQCWLREFEWKNRKLIKHAEQNSMLLPQSYFLPETQTFYPERTVKLSFRNIQSKISFRELDCLHLHCRGFTCSHIAYLLGISPRTAETHLESVKNRFGLSSRDELAALGYANPLVQNYSPRLT